jgi:ribosomal protein S6--L-glutamate ligase
MRLVEPADLAEAREAIERFREEGNRVLYIQQRISMPDADLGVVFLGEDYLTTYTRVRAAGAWNTTTRAGGTYGCHEISAETLALARRARDLFELDFTVVDVVITEDGTYVFEVSAFGGFRGILEGCGIDAAGAYAEYALANSPCRTLSA